MDDTDSFTADVLVRAGHWPDADRVLVDELRALGIEARVRELPVTRLADPLTWVVLLSLPLHAFLAGLGTKLGEDAYGWLKELPGRVSGRRSGGEAGRTSGRVMAVRDSVSGIEVILEPDLPEEAIRQLTALDLGQFRRGPVHYDRHHARWRSHLDEIERQRNAP